MNEPTPMLSTWMGRPLADLTREELIEALNHCGRVIEAMREAATGERRTWLEVLRRLEP